MQITDEQRAKDEADYAAAFDSDQEMTPEPTEDQAFGLTPEADESDADPDAGLHGEQPMGDAPLQDAAAAEGAEAKGPNDETAFEAEGDDADPAADATRDEDELQGATNGTAEGAEDAPGADEPVDLVAEPGETPMTEQQLRSWQGRLRKMQQDLEAKATATGQPAEVVTADAIEAVAEKADDPELAARAHEKADAVESGELSPEKAMAQLSEDFGEDFVRLIQVIAKHSATEAGSKAADERVGQVSQSVQEIISHISDKDAKAHFKAIAKAHPDFNELAGSPEFKSFIDGLPGVDKGEAERVIKSGDADEIIDLLSKFKGSKAPAADAVEEPAGAAPAVTDPKVDAEMDAAEGVRSSGLRLPEQPAAAGDSYEDAWKEFSSK